MQRTLIVCGLVRLPFFVPSSMVVCLMSFIYILVTTVPGDKRVYRKSVPLQQVHVWGVSQIDPFS